MSRTYNRLGQPDKEKEAEAIFRMPPQVGLIGIAIIEAG